MGKDIYKLLKQYKAPDQLKQQVDEVLSGEYKFNESNQLLTARYKLPKTIAVGEGKGKADLYDKAIPSYLKKYAKNGMLKFMKMRLI